MAGKAARAVYKAPVWPHLRRRVFDRDGWRCRSCGRTGALECDHVKPIDQGGEPFDMDNLQALCRGCHVAKTARDRRQQSETPERLAWRQLVVEIAHAAV